jgi:hypothetical protein
MMEYLSLKRIFGEIPVTLGYRSRSSLFKTRGFYARGKWSDAWMADYPLKRVRGGVGTDSTAPQSKPRLDKAPSARLHNVYMNACFPSSYRRKGLILLEPPVGFEPTTC